MIVLKSLIFHRISLFSHFSKHWCQLSLIYFCQIVRECYFLHYRLANCVTENLWPTLQIISKAKYLNEES